MGDELFDPWFNESDIDLMRHGYDVPRTCFRAGWDLAQERIAELEQELLEERASYEAERQRLRDALVSIADGYIYPLTLARQTLEK